MPENNGKWMRKAAQASTIGIVMAVSVAIGYGIGILLKRVFHTGDWIIYVFLMLGIVAGFVEMIRMAISLSKD